MTWYNILVNLKEIKCNRNKNVYLFIPWNRTKILKYFTNWMILCDFFQGGYIHGQIDRQLLKSQYKKWNNKYDEWSQERNNGRCQILQRKNLKKQWRRVERFQHGNINVSKLVLEVFIALNRAPNVVNIWIRLGRMIKMIRLIMSNQRLRLL